MSLPRWAQELSYRVVPSRRQLVEMIHHLQDAAPSLIDTQKTIAEMIHQGTPFYVGRPGGTESQGTEFFVAHRLNSLEKNRRPYPRWFTRYVQVGPGVVHFTQADLDTFCHEYLLATLEADILAFGRFAPGVVGLARHKSAIGGRVVDYINVEPLIAVGEGATPWTHALTGKRVLVVHPFEDSIRFQYAQKGQVSTIAELLPDFTLDVLRPPVTFAGEGSTEPWHVHFERLVREALLKHFDVAIIGAGSYGLPLARALRNAGKQAIHLGGTTQLLFGIRGRRWDTDPQYRDFCDDTWVRPLESERPKNASLVEGAVYW